MGQSSVAEPALQAGSRRYRVDGELARGGMGVVYRAFDRVRGRAIALKRPHAAGELESQRRGAELLEREYRTLTALKHPRIIEVHDYGHDEQGPYYTMELLDGTDLSAICPLPWRETCSLLRDVASSLALVHARRLLHRDVSPANIRISDQRAKLLDFGTMVPFGKHPQIAGTPACVAPEVFELAELDQRVDLFALGATAYYALCGRAAYPATSLKQLPGLWAQHKPQPPSAHVPGIPEALDQLVLALLALDPLSRPVSAGEVIDRLRAIAELPGDEDERVARSYLECPALVGREEPRARLLNRLSRMLSGAGGVVLVESALGYGKSALLAELSREALVRGALVLPVAGRTHREPLSACRALLATAQLELAGQLELLVQRPADNENGGQPSEQRLEREVEAIVEALLTVAARRPVLLLVDDADQADAHSIEVLVKLSRAIADRRLLIALSADVDSAAEQMALRPLRRAAMRVQLAPLSREDIEGLLRTVFGEVPDLKRLTGWLQRETEGSPLLCMEMLAELIDKRLIRYADGLWFLPQDLSGHARPTTGKVFERRLLRLSPSARTLAGCLSVRRLPPSLDLCRTIAQHELPAHPELAVVLDELVAKHVLLQGEGEYIFSHSELQSLLYAQLGEEQKRRVHRLLAAYFEPRSTHDPALRAEVGCHLYLAGDELAAQPYFTALVPVTQDAPLLLRAAPALTVVQQKYDELPHEPGELSVTLVPLLMAGLYVEPTIFDRVGMSTLEALEELCGMRLARRIARFTGATLAVLLGLLFSYLRWRFDRSPKRWTSYAYPLAYFAVVAQMGAQALFRGDRAMNQALHQRMASIGRLGKRSIVQLVFDGLVAGRALLAGRFATSLHEIREMDGYIPKVRELDARAKRPFSEMNRFWEGRTKLFTAGNGALETAASLRTSELSFHWVLGELLRYAYYLSRGELMQAEKARDSLDTLAARYGGTWTADLLTALEFGSFHAAGDVVGLKRCLDQLEELVRMHPSIATQLQVARAMYESRRGRPERALAIYEAIAAQLEPFECDIWSLAQGHWVECLNALQRHQEARTRSERMLAHAGGLSDEFPLAYMQLARERALALCALSEYDKASAALDQLLARHGAADQPLMVGLLHRDRAVVAAAAAEADTFEQHMREAQQRFAGTRNPALIAQIRSLQRLGKLQGVDTPSAGFAGHSQELTLLMSTAQGAALPRTARAERLLEQLVRIVGASSARLYLTPGGQAQLLAQCGADDWSPQLAEQVVELARLSGEHATTALTSAQHRSAQLACREQLVAVLAQGGAQPRVLAVLALLGAARADELTPVRLARLAVLLGSEPGSEELC